MKALSSYEKLRPALATGDVIAFSGNGRISGAIKWMTHSCVSHVGIVVRRQLEDARGIDFVDVAEAAMDGPKVGVVTHRLSDCVEQYDGGVWWCPLSPGNRARLDAEALGSWLFRSLGRGYNFLGAIRAGLGIATSEAQHESDSLFFCSELVVRALMAGGVLDSRLSPEGWTPRDVVAARLYGPLVQMSGASQSLPGYSLLDPSECDRQALARW